MLHHPVAISHFGSRRHFLPCDALETPAFLVGALVQLLDVRLREVDPLASLASHLENLPATLLVLDGLDAVWSSEEHKANVETILNLIASHPAIALLITQRGTARPNGVQWSSPILPPLPTLSSTDSIALYNKHCSRSGSIPGHLVKSATPFLILLLARRVAQIPLHEHPQFWEEWTQIKDSHSTESDTLLPAAIQLSLASDTLQRSEALQLLCMLSRLPAGLSSTAFPELTRAFTAPVHARGILLTMGLAYEDHGVLMVHRPVAEHVRARYQIEAAHLGCLEAHFLQMGRSTKALGAAVGELPNIRAVLLDMLQRQRPEAARTELAFAKHLVRIGVADCQFLRMVLEQAQLLDDSHRAKAHQYLGQMELLNADLPRAEAQLQLAIPLFEQSNHKLDVAHCFLSLGLISRVRGDYDQAYRHIEGAMKNFDAVGDTFGRAQALWSLGELHLRRAQYPAAVKSFSAAQDHFMSVQQALGAATCLQSIAGAYAAASSHHEASVAFGRAADAFKAAQHPLGAARSAVCLGDSWITQSRPQDAIKAFQRAADIYSSIGYDASAAEVDERLAKLYASLGRFPKALEKISQSLYVAKQLCNPPRVAHCLFAQAGFQMDTRRYADAVQSLLECQKNYEKAGDESGRAGALKGLGSVYARQHRYADAEAAFLYAHAAFAARGEQADAAECLRGLGDVHLAQDDHVQAVSAFSTARADFGALGRTKEAAECLHFLGVINLARKEYAAAQADIQTALSELQIHGPSRATARCVHFLGLIAFARGDTRDATRLVNEAKAAFQLHADKHAAAECIRDLGDIAFKEGDYPGAEAAYLGAAAVFKSVEDWYGVGRALQSVARLYRACGDVERAVNAWTEAGAAFENAGCSGRATQCLISQRELLLSV